MTEPSTEQITRAGAILATMISSGVQGETRSWSKVPSSRSRAMDSPVVIRVENITRMPPMLGTTNHW